MDFSDRVSMSAGIFSPDGKNFCQLMTPNTPKPMFLAHFHRGHLYLIFQKLTWGPFGGPQSLGLGSVEDDPSGATHTMAALS